jgi:hypothetical protein
MNIHASQFPDEWINAMSAMPSSQHRVYLGFADSMLRSNVYTCSQ